jgi:hypothetical protein
MQIYKTALVRFDDSTRELPVTALDEMRAASIMAAYFQNFGEDVLSAKAIRVTPSNGRPVEFATKLVIDWRIEHESEFRTAVVPPVKHAAIQPNANTSARRNIRRRVSSL